MDLGGCSPRNAFVAEWRCVDECGPRTGVNVQRTGRYLMAFVAGVVGVAGGVALLDANQTRGESEARVSNATRASQPEWSRVPLDGGRVEGHIWGVGAKVIRYEPLRRGCLIASTIAPPPPGQEYVVADEGSSCGRLSRPSDVVSMSMRIGGSADSEARLIEAFLYTPVVRSVELTVDGGERRRYRTRSPGLKGHASKGIPRLRYLVVSLESEACVKRIVTYDASGRRIEGRAAEAAC